MTDEEIREQKLQVCQQYGITEKQLDDFAAVFNKLWEDLKEIVNGIMAGLQELAAGFREALQQTDLSGVYEAIEAIRAAYKPARPPSYSLANTRHYNAMQRQKLKSYKNRIGSAAIRRPKRIARSCC
jgi:hypothetical protein